MAGAPLIDRQEKRAAAHGTVDGQPERPGIAGALMVGLPVHAHRARDARKRARLRVAATRPRTQRPPPHELPRWWRRTRPKLVGVDERDRCHENQTAGQDSHVGSSTRKAARRDNAAAARRFRSFRQ
jgi:hypothetical protein